MPLCFAENGDACDLTQTLRSAPDSDGPVMILVHGYKHSPDAPLHDPHKHIFAYAPRGDFRAVSWPKSLGFDAGRQQSALCLAFSWSARGRFRDVYDGAVDAATALADVIGSIKQCAPNRPVHIVAHSLGVKVALEALHGLDAGSVERAIFLSGAEFASKAQAAMTTPAGRTLEIFNITTRENDLFDALFEIGMGRLSFKDWSVGGGLIEPLDRWVNIQIDHPETLRMLRSLGYAIERPRKRVCHWSTYTRKGAMPFYAGLMRYPNELPIALFQQRLPQRQHRRWARAVALPEWRPITQRLLS